jgi:hypothetical protein
MPDMDGDNQFKRNIDLNKDTDLGNVLFAESSLPSLAMPK